MILCFFSYVAYADTGGTGLWVIQCVSVDYSPECHQNESIPNYFTIFDFIFTT